MSKSLPSIFSKLKCAARSRFETRIKGCGTTQSPPNAPLVLLPNATWSICNVRNYAWTAGQAQTCPPHVLPRCEISLFIQILTISLLPWLAFSPSFLSLAPSLSRSTFVTHVLYQFKISASPEIVHSFLSLHIRFQTPAFRLLRLAPSLVPLTKNYQLSSVAFRVAHDEDSLRIREHSSRSHEC